MNKYRILVLALFFGMLTSYCQFSPKNIKNTISADISIPVTAEEEVCTESHLTLSELMERGAGIYDRSCRGCHGMTGEGTPNGFFPGLKGSGITQQKDFQVPYQYLMTTDIHPVASTLFEKDVASVMTFIRNSFGNSASVVCPEDIELRLFP